MVQKENATVNYRETDGAPPSEHTNDFYRKRFYDGIKCIHDRPCYRDYLKTEQDVFIKLFGKIRIETLKGAVTSDQINRARYDLIKFLAFSDNPVSSAEIMNQINPNGSPRNLNDVRQLIYRTRQATGHLLSKGSHLIETTQTGYRLSAYLNIITDFSCFDEYCGNALDESDPIKKAEYLQKAIDLYRGDIQESNDCGDKIGSAITSKYNRIFQNIIEEYCQIQYSLKNYDMIHQAATDAWYRGLNDPDIHYWIYMSLFALNRTVSAEKYIEAVYHDLDRQSAELLKKRISESLNSIINNDV